MNPALSPDGKHLAYIDFISGRPTLYIRSLTGGRTAAVGKSAVSIDPGWRNNNEVAATLSFDGNQEIYLVNTDGTLSRRVTNSKSIDVFSRWQQDGLCLFTQWPATAFYSGSCVRAGKEAYLQRSL
jgi:TolB protein